MRRVRGGWNFGDLTSNQALSRNIPNASQSNSCEGLYEDMLGGCMTDAWRIFINRVMRPASPDPYVVPSRILGLGVRFGGGLHC